ncbi:MAG TPA: winged helix-turn-helix domain-containing protein [Pyrinomonadaceae bacterium]|jgi:TolB-like protein/DNA-binding winged helix-turn-helix (wHTH) protein/Tfp pilus assembly protein PilF
MLSQEEHIYEFGPFRLNTEAKLFFKEGKPVQLNPKTFELLVMLVRRAGRLIEKEELLRELWPDSFVEESNLTQNIYLLRKALGEDVHGNVYIKTVPRHGYRFMAEVRAVLEEIKDEEQADTDVSPDVSPDASLARTTSTRMLAPIEEADHLPSLPERAESSVTLPDLTPSTTRRWRVRAALLAAVISLSLLAALAFFWNSAGRRRAATRANIRAIAVLPFKTVGAEGQSEMLGLGMADAIIIKISKLQQIPVLPTSAVIKYTGREVNAVAVGHDLGVDVVLDGTVQRSGDRIRVTVQLIGVADGKTLWSEVYDEPFRDIFEVQDVISEHVAESLKPDLSGEEKAQIAKRYTQNMEAYEAYVRGLYFWNKRSEEGLEKAIQYFQQAVERDPGFSLAYAGLADAYGLIGYFGYKLLSFDEAHTKAKSAATRALELDETLSEAHTAMAMIKEIYEWDKTGAEREHRRAIALNPNSSIAHLRYSAFLNSENRHEEAFEETMKARALDPLSAVVNFNLGLSFYYRRDFTQATEYCRKAIEIEPNYVPPQIVLGMIHTEMGLYTEALAQLTRARGDARGNLYPLTLEALGYTYAAMGRRAEAQKVLLELDELGRKEASVLLSKVSILARLGQTRQAFEILERQFAGVSAMPYWLRADPKYESLRAAPEYKEFLRRHNFTV